MIEIKAFEIEKGTLKSLPLFYNYVYYNELINLDNYYLPPYSDKMKAYIPYARSAKLLSKIVDFSKINEDINYDDNQRDER